jgi:two-component system nitrate/nitrite response regulator NarL
VTLPPRTRVLIADDHPLYHEGVAGALGAHPSLELVGRVELGREAVEEIRRLRPDVALVDLRLPDMDGIGVVEALRREGVPTRVVIISAYEDSATVYRAIAAGADAYLSKASSAPALVRTIEAVARGETVIPSSMQAGLVEQIRAREVAGDEPALTSRELEVLRHTADGLSAPEIAQELVLGVTTVKTHLHNIYGKLGVSDRAAAVATAMRRGLLP